MTVRGTAACNSPLFTVNHFSTLAPQLSSFRSSRAGSHPRNQSKARGTGPRRLSCLQQRTPSREESLATAVASTRARLWPPPRWPLRARGWGWRRGLRGGALGGTVGPCPQRRGRGQEPHHPPPAGRVGCVCEAAAARRRPPPPPRRRGAPANTRRPPPPCVARRLWARRPRRLARGGWWW